MNKFQCKIIKSENTYSLDCIENYTTGASLLFEVYDTSGKLLFSEKVNQNSSVKTSLQPGVYIISFRTKAEIIASKKQIIIN